MKEKNFLRHLSIVFAVIFLLFALLPFGKFTAHAAGTSFNYGLSYDGNVRAIYNSTTKVLSINGSGTIDYYRWKTMAQMINPLYFDGSSAWDINISEDDAEISFHGSAGAIKLCGSGGISQRQGMFKNFSGDIYFNNAVDLSTTANSIAGMFENATKFNQPVNWGTSNVTNMNWVFCGATSFNQPVNWNTSNVWMMSGIFEDATSFNQPVDFDTSNVRHMGAMFRNATSFNQPVDFDTSNVIDIMYMFSGATSFNQPIDFDTSKARYMVGVFDGATSFNQPVKFNTRNAIGMQHMFRDTPAFNRAINFNVRSADSVAHMFENSAVKTVSLYNTSPSNVDIDGQHIFDGCSALERIAFTGIKDVSIDGMSADYYVQEGDDACIAKNAAEGYDFTDNITCSAYLRSSVPTITLSADGSGINVSWLALLDATGYVISRSDSLNGDYSEIAYTTNLSYTDTTDLVPGMPYFYRVQASYFNSIITTYGDFSESKGYYAPGELAEPDKPELTLDENAGGIRLNWNSQDRIIGYQVFRALSPDKPFSYLKTASGNATRYTNLAGLTPGRPFYYKIRAYRMAKGVRAYSPFSDIEGMFAGTNEHALGAVSFSLEDNPSVSAPNVRIRWTQYQRRDQSQNQLLWHAAVPRFRWHDLLRQYWTGEGV